MELLKSDYKKLALRVYNRNKSYVLFQKRNTGLWGLPETSIFSKDDDPFNHIQSVLCTIPGNYEIVSAVNIIEKKQWVNCSMYWFFIYSVEYKGKILPQLEQLEASPQKEKISNICWVQHDNMKEKADLSLATEIYLDVLSAEASIR